jgi:hypothetical protein
VSRSPAAAGTTEETITKVKVATEAGASHGKIAGNQREEAKNLTGPLAGLPHRHLVAEAEAEAVAEDLALAQKPRAAAHAMPENASMSTDLTTSAQNALAE